MTGMTDAMRQYERFTEEILKNNRPKHPKSYGIRRPDSNNIVAVLAGLFVLLVVVSTVL